MLERVLKTISRYNMLPPGSRVIAAVSGGPDSVCLLHVLAELAPQASFALEIAHLNHMLRGAESEADQRFVEELAAKLNLRLHSARTDVAAALGSREPTGRNLEQAARRARQAFFASLTGNGASGRVATGHTRDDQAETVLLRLLRGSGLAGLAGILPVTSAGVVRPLLEVTRAEVIEHLRERNLAWREDSSNVDLRFARNRVRHQLIPQLAATWNPRLTDALAQLADLSCEEERWWRGPGSPLQGFFENSEAVRSENGAGRVELRADALAALPRAVARRVIRRAIAQAKGDLRRVEFDHVERVLDLAARDRGEGRLHVPDLEIRRSFDWIRLSRPATRTGPGPVALKIPGSYPSPDGKSLVQLEIAALDPAKPAPAEPGEDRSCVNLGTAVLDLDRIPGELQLRGWRPGDRYRPMGQARGRRVAELFAESRIPSWRRSEWPMVTSGDNILWVRQFGPAAEYAATALEEGRQIRPVLRISETKSGRL